MKVFQLNQAIITALAISCLIAGCSQGAGVEVTATLPAAGTPPQPPPPPQPPQGIDESLFDRQIDTSANASLADKATIADQIRYGPYTNQADAEALQIIPDFSHAGYMGGGIPLPDPAAIPVVHTLAPAPSGDDFARVQAAIDEIASMPEGPNGIRGALLLKAGRYRLSQTVIVPTGGIVIRGEGQGVSGTILESTSTSIDDVAVSVVGGGSGHGIPSASPSLLTRITQEYVPVGSVILEVENPNGFRVGDSIAVRRTPNDTWLGSNGIDTAQYGWTTSSFELEFERSIVDIEGDRFTIDIPVVDTIEDRFGGGEIYLSNTNARFQKVGIENLRIESRQSTDKSNRNRAFYGIVYSHVENSWIRDVTVRYFSHGFLIDDGTRFITVEDVAYLDPDFEIVGGNNYGFNFEGGQQNLVQRCYGRGGRHTFVTGSRVQGPNVFLDCVAEQTTSDDGPHQRWATGVLWDNLNGQLFQVQNRRSSGTGHGWAGAQQMLWNSEFERIAIEGAPGAMSWGVGNVGTIIQGSLSSGGNPGIFESHNVPIDNIRSLYLAQLEDRLGAEAVDAITHPLQRNERIWNELKAWRGEGLFAE